MTELVFYTHPISRGRIVRWMLEEVGASYRTDLLDYGTTMKADAYRAINPMGKVPAIRHGDTIVTEAAAICAYLADAFPDAGLAPPPADRGDYYRWLFFAAGPVEQAVVNAAMGFAVPEGKELAAGWGSLDAVCDVLDDWLATHAYFAGDRFTAADVYAGAQIGWGIGFGTMPMRPNFEAYVARIDARPAAVRAREIDDGLLAQAAPHAG